MAKSAASQTLQENSWVKVSFLIKLQTSGVQLYEKRDFCLSVFLWILRSFFLSKTSNRCFYIFEFKVRGTKFKTIPESIWWAINTMTTVGYGDMTPTSTEGKIFGAFCATCSILILALPVSVIGNIVF